MQYEQTLARVETYFDQTATKTWERLTSDAPVSRIRQTVREGRDQMRARLLSRLPSDVAGLRILDAGCGAGQLTLELAQRSAQVTAVDISPALIDIARKRIPTQLHDTITFQAGDLLNPDLGSFDYIIGMDSLIYYKPPVLAQTLTQLKQRCTGSILFTVAPKTPLLMAMWYAGKLAPRGDKSPVMVPQSAAQLSRHLGNGHRLTDIGRVHRGFYISQALEVTA
mgnify:FL=1